MMLLISAAQGLVGAASGVAWQAWIQAGVLAVLATILGALLLVLLEVRKLAREWSAFVKVARDRTGPLVDHATNAVRNLDHVCRVAREGADRLEGALGRVADEADKAASHARTRLQEMVALVDLAQSEAEDAVLDVATKVRLARRGAGLAQWLGRGGSRQADEDAPEPENPVAAPQLEAAGAEAVAGEERVADAETVARPRP